MRCVLDTLISEYIAFHIKPIARIDIGTVRFYKPRIMLKLDVFFSYVSILCCDKAVLMVWLGLGTGLGKGKDHVLP